jgi:hypothetical protein
MITPDENITSRIYHYYISSQMITLAPDDNIAAQMITFNTR